MRPTPISVLLSEANDYFSLFGGLCSLSVFSCGITRGATICYPLNFIRSQISARLRRVGCRKKGNGGSSGLGHRIDFLISAFDRTWNILQRCQRSVRPTYFDRTWADLLFKTGMHTESGWIFKNSGDLHTAFEVIITVAHRFGLPFQKVLSAMTVISSAEICIKKKEFASSRIFSDSMVAHEYIGNRFANPRGSSLAGKIVNLVPDENRSGMSIVLIWVLIHGGMYGNEIADQCVRWHRNLNFRVQIGLLIRD